MRIIKFRAYCKYDKTMWTAQDLIDNGYQLYADGRIHMPLLDGSGDSSKEFILMQYTGLKRHGREIYEGDIMDRRSLYKGQETKTVVKWSTSYCRWEGCFGDKVIGNIYENQELLKIDKD